MTYTQNGGGVPRQGSAATVLDSTTNHGSPTPHAKEVPTPVVVGVVTIDVGNLDRLDAIPPGVEVCLDLGNRRAADLINLDRIAGATWDMRAVKVQGKHPEAVSYATDCLKRAHRQHAMSETRRAREAANHRDAWWNGDM